MGGISTTLIACKSETKNPKNDDGWRFWRWVGIFTLLGILGAVVPQQATALIQLPIISPKMDFNIDGNPDILWRDSAGHNALWTMNGATLAAVNGLPTVATSWQVVGVGDFTGDGRADVLWRDSTGHNALWTMNGAAVSAINNLPPVPTSWQVVGVGDFNLDGKSDILWRDSAGHNALWTMNGPTRTAVNGLPTVATSWQVVGVGDFTGDGRADILWRDSAGHNALWTMNGGAVTAINGLPTVATSWQVAGVGNFNADGKSDILWRDSAGHNALWTMNGTTVTAINNLPTVATNWQVVGVDYSSIYGRAYILWRDSTGHDAIWAMNGSTRTAVNGLPTVATSWQVQPSATLPPAPPSPPAAPSGLSAVAPSSTSITLTWSDNSANETGFKIERGSTSTGPWIQIATVGANIVSYTNTGLSAFAQYFYRVRAYNAAGNSAYTAATYAITMHAAPSLAGPTSATGPFDITATFNWAGGLASNFDGYVFQESLTSATTGFTTFYSPLNRTSPMIVTVTPPTGATGTRYYRVKAIKQGISSEWSSVLAVALSVPTATTQTFYASAANTIMYTTNIPAHANTVYAAQLAVGCDFVIGPFASDFSCKSGLIKFNLLPTLTGKTINSAMLILTPTLTPADYSGPNYTLAASFTAWNPGTVTYNNYAQTYITGSNISVPLPLSTALPLGNSVSGIDVTATVQNWASGTWTDYGFYLWPNDFLLPVLSVLRSTYLDAATAQLVVNYQ